MIDSVKGTFISKPSNSYKKDGKMQYSDICHPIRAEARNELIDKVIEAYEAKLSEEQDMDDLSEDETAEYNDESDNAENQEENYTHERYPVSKKKNGTRINSTPPSRRRKSSQKSQKVAQNGQT